MLTSEIPVVQRFTKPHHNTRGEGVKDKKLSGDYLLDVCTSSL